MRTKLDSGGTVDGQMGMRASLYEIWGILRQESGTARPSRTLGRDYLWLPSKGGPMHF